MSPTALFITPYKIADYFSSRYKWADKPFPYPILSQIAIVSVLPAVQFLPDLTCKGIEGGTVSGAMMGAYADTSLSNISKVVKNCLKNKGGIPKKVLLPFLLFNAELSYIDQAHKEREDRLDHQVQPKRKM